MSFTKFFKSVPMLAIAMLAALVATGCNTIEGAGKDIERAGEEIEEAASS